MAAVTSAAMARLRRNLGDTSGAFSDDELANLLAEQGADEDRALRQGLWELLAQGARWHDYTTDVAQEKKSQVFDQLTTLYREVNGRIVDAEAAASGAAAREPVQTTAVRRTWGF